MFPRSRVIVLAQSDFLRCLAYAYQEPHFPDAMCLGSYIVMGMYAFVSQTASDGMMIPGEEGFEMGFGVGGKSREVAN